MAMEENDFRFFALTLLAANLVSLFVIGAVLLEEIGRRPRVVGIYEGDSGRRDRPPDLGARDPGNGGESRERKEKGEAE